MAGLAASATIRSPMPGTVLSFKVDVGQEVKRGDVLLILEAMKMENEIVATQAGRVLALKVSAGSSVNTGDSLVDLA
jgi:biotin carboxyl carrier protein